MRVSDRWSASSIPTACSWSRVRLPTAAPTSIASAARSGRPAPICDSASGATLAQRNALVARVRAGLGQRRLAALLGRAPRRGGGAADRGERRGGRGPDRAVRRAGRQARPARGGDLLSPARRRLGRSSRRSSPAAASRISAAPTPPTARSSTRWSCGSGAGSCARFALAGTATPRPARPAVRRAGGAARGRPRRAADAARRRDERARPRPPRAARLAARGRRPVADQRDRDGPRALGERPSRSR